MRTDLEHDVVVVRVGLHRLGRAPHVHDDQSRVGGGDNAQHLGVGSAAGDVVHDDRARAERGCRHARFGRIDADGDTTRRERRYHREHTVAFGVGVDRVRARARGLSSDVDERGSVLAQTHPVRDRGIGNEELPTVGKRVGRDVHDSHHRPPRQVGDGERVGHGRRLPDPHRCTL